MPTLILKARFEDGSVQCYEAKNWKEGFITAALARGGFISLEDMETGEVRSFKDWCEGKYNQKSIELPVPNTCKEISPIKKKLPWYLRIISYLRYPD